MSEEFPLEKYVISGLVGLVVLLLFLLCGVYRRTRRRDEKEGVKERAKRRPRHKQAHGGHHVAEEQVSWLPRPVTRALQFPTRVWQKYRYGRVIMPQKQSMATQSTDVHENSDIFPVTRLLASPGLVVVYSKEFVDDFATERTPRRQHAGRKRYALILKSAKREAKQELEGYFDAVLEDILNVRQELKQELVEHSGRCSSLKLLGKRVLPLKQRGSPVTKETPVQAICDYKQIQGEVSQGEKCILLDNSQQQNWKVLTSKGKECDVPSVCFVIPAPNIEAQEYMTSLEIQYKHLLTSWKSKYTSLSRDLANQEVSSSVKVLELPEKVKLPSLEDVGSKDLEKLLKEVAECKDIDFDLDSSTNNASQPSLVEEPIRSQDVVQTFAESSESQPLSYTDHTQSTIDDLLHWVEDTEKILKSKSRHDSLDINIINQELQAIKDIQTERLFRREPQYETLTQQEKPDQPGLEEKYELLQEKWKDTCNKLEDRQKRLELLHTVVELVDGLQRWISNVELILCRQPGLTNQPEELRKQLKELREIQIEMQPRRERIYQLKQASLKLSPPGSDHATMVIARWEKLSNETQTRSSRLQANVEVLENYQTFYEIEERWVSQTEELLASDEFLRISEEPSETRMGRFSEFFSECRKHAKAIENVVSMGNQYVFDSEDFENSLKNYARYVNAPPDDTIFEYATQAREGIGSDLKSLRDRFAALQQGFEDTRGQLLRAFHEHGTEHPEIEDETTQWNSSVQRLLDWVESQEQSLASQSPPSLDQKELREQLDKHRELSKEVLASQHPVETTLRQGRRFLEGHTEHLPASTRTELDTKMVSLEIRWMRLQRESDNRYRRLVVIHEKLIAFEEVVHPFVAWLGRAESQADAILTADSDLDTVQERMERHQDFVSDVKRHEADLKEVNHHGEVFLHEAKVLCYVYTE